MPDAIRCVLRVPPQRTTRGDTNFWGWANWIAADSASKLVVRLQTGPTNTGTVLRLMFSRDHDEMIVERAVQRVDRTTVLAPVRYSKTTDGRSRR
jgi:hypothetical protein